jgi:hypothetical protein
MSISREFAPTIEQTEIDETQNHPLFKTACLVEIEKYQMLKEIASSKGFSFVYFQSCTFQDFLNGLLRNIFSFLEELQRHAQTNSKLRFYAEEHEKAFKNINPKSLEEFMTKNPQLSQKLSSANPEDQQTFYQTCAFFRLSDEYQKIAKKCISLDHIDFSATSVLQEHE